MLNEKLLEVMGDDVTQEQAFAHANDARVSFGTACGESLGDQLRVTVIATGLHSARKAVVQRR